MDHSHMDHGHMDHGHMDHGGHGSMPGMDHGDMGNMCSMNMIFTWNTQNLCVVFDWWQIKGPLSLIFTLVAVALLTAGYEAIREASRRYDAKSAEGVNRLPPDTSDDTLGNDRSLRSWFARLGQNQAGQEQRDKMIKAFLYAVQVFYSFFIMLLFMTYNGFIMLAVAVGAFIGYLAFGQGPSAKTVACH